MARASPTSAYATPRSRDDTSNVVIDGGEIAASTYEC